MTRTKFISALLLCLGTTYMHAQEIPKLVISQLTDDCYIFTTWQDYKGTPYPANGMYVLTPGGAVMIDAPWDTTQTRPLLDTIAARHGQQVTLCIATHFHSDRTGGFDILRSKGIRTYSSARTLELCKERNEQQAAYTFNKDTSFNIGGVQVQTYYPGPGHTEDNIVIWLPGRKILYGGCFIKSTDAKGLGNLSDADPGRWDNSIRNVMRRFPDPRFVIPGHERWSNRRSLQHTLELVEAYQRDKKQ